MDILGRVAAGAIAVVLALAAASAGAAETGRITVTGEGHVAAVPDMATITLGVTTEAATAAEAMAQNSARQAQVFAALKAAGIADRDMQSSGLSLNPRWVHPKDRDLPAQMVGFVASNDVTVRVRALHSLGTVLDTLVRAGANNVNGLRFGLSKPEPLMDEARQAAVAEARRKAALYAKAAGVTLGPIVSINEGGGGGMPRPMMRMAAEAAPMPVPVAAGELDVDASVTMVFTIAQ